MNKKLVFAFYVPENFYSDIINLHFNCLEKYKNSFDSVEVVFILDENYNAENLLEAENRFAKIFLGKPLSFSMVPNTKYREAIVFYEYVAKKLADNELVFFAHNKGITNVVKYDVNQVYTWVIGMYYYSLNFMDEVEDMLLNKKFMSYGPFLTQNEEPENPTKYGWYYIGTFFWVNGKKVWQYMKNNDIELPVMGDRFYGEEFLANIFPSWPYVTAGSHETRFLKNANDFYHNAVQYLNWCYSPEEDGFNKFYKEITDGKAD